MPPVPDPMPQDLAPDGWWTVVSTEDVEPFSYVGIDDPVALTEAQAKGAAPWDKHISTDLQQSLRLKAVTDFARTSGSTIALDMIGTYRRPDGSWIFYQKTRASVDSTLYESKGAVDARVAALNLEAGRPQYESYASTNEGEGGNYRIREKSDVADRVDPDKPIEQEIPLGNGQSVYILSNGRLVTGETDIDWTGWDADDNTHTIGNKEMVELPNGEIVEKSVDAVAADATPVSTTTLDDGSRVVLFKDGTRQMISGGKVSTVALDEATGYVVVTDSKGNPSLKKPIFESGIEYTAAGYNILTGPEGPIEDLGLPETPGALETIGGQQFVRGTKGQLTALDGVLDRMIEHALVTGDVDTALAWDDFRKRPSSQEALDAALAYAKAPGDQQLISALHYATSEQAAGMPGAMGPSAEQVAGGQFAEVAPPPQFLQDAYQRFQDSMTGGRMPTSDEFAAAIAREEEPPAPTVREQLELDILEAKLAETEAATLRADAESEAKLAKSSAEAEAILKKANSEAERLLEKSRADIDRAERELEFKMRDTAGTLPLGEGTQEDEEEDEEEGAGKETRTLWNPSAADGDGAYQEVTGTTAKLDALVADGTYSVERPVIKAADTGQTMMWDPHTKQWRNVNNADVPAREGDGWEQDKTITVYDEDGDKRDILNSQWEEHKALGYTREKPSTEVVATADPVQGAFGPRAVEGAAEKAAEKTAGVTFDPGETAISLSDPETGRVGGIDYGGTGTNVGLSTADVLNIKASQAAEAAEASKYVPFTGVHQPGEFEEAGPAPSFADQLSAAGVTGGTGGYHEIPASTSVGFDGRTIDEIRSEWAAAAAEDADRRPDYQTLAADIEALSDVGSAIATGASTAANVAQSGSLTGLAQTIGGGLANLISRSPGGQRRAEASRDAAAAEYQERLEENQAAQGWVLEGANGVRTDDRMTLVGESGPELALFPNGTEIVPLDRRMKRDQARRLRRRGIRGMEEGGLVFAQQGEEDRPGLGLSRVLSGQAVGPSQGRLFRAAGFTTPSAQALRNLLPEEIEQFRGMGARARIPEGTFERELAQGVASGQRRTGSARFLPLSLRR